MIQFILNQQLIKTNEPAGSTLLDFVRYKKHLVGTKIGCREGDCGACTLLMGDLRHGKMVYKTLTSCITPLGNAHGKHIVTIEGLNMEELSPFQQAMVDESGQQCGFCTVGFIVSFAGECLSSQETTYDKVISAIDGNICRCTGYKSIERAAAIVYEKLKNKDPIHSVDWCVKNGFVPAYFKEIAQQISGIEPITKHADGLVVGGGTDLLVQKHDAVYESDIHLFADKSHLQGIQERNGYILIGAATNTTELLNSPILKPYFPRLWDHLKLVSSTPIRNIATVAGNLINASPIGDLTAFFIALDTEITLNDKIGTSQTLKLKDLYKGYKTLAKRPDEYVVGLQFPIPDQHTYFNFEKVSKRRYLDIATVNSGIKIKVIDEVIQQIHISAGGVGPIPTYLTKTCEYLTGKPLNEQSIKESFPIMQSEVSPISDARGTESYKRLLLRQLFYAHFVELFPSTFKIESIL